MLLTVNGEKVNILGVKGRQKCMLIKIKFKILKKRSEIQKVLKF